MKQPARGLCQTVAIALSLLCSVVTANATIILPTSYDMPNGSGVARGGEYNYWDRNYTGSGDRTTDGATLTGGLGKLTDGIIATQSWEWTDASGIGHTQQNFEGTGPYVGWTWGDPTITFHFGNYVNIDTVTFYVDNPGNDIYGNPRGGVAAPRSITINGFEHATGKPSPGNGPMGISFFDLGLDNVNELVVTLNRDESPFSFWVFMSEVTFDDGINVPEPGTVLLLGAGLAGIGLFRLRRRNQVVR